jgi:hypothetical protein
VTARADPAKLAAAMKRQRAKDRPDVQLPVVLVSSRGGAYDASGIDTMLDRLPPPSAPSRSDPGQVNQSYVMCQQSEAKSQKSNSKN